MEAERGKSDAIRLADWIELNVLFGEVPSVSVIEATDDIRGAPPDDAAEAEQATEAWELAERLADDAFRELRRRAGWLGTRYPLTIDADVASFFDDGASVAAYRFLVLLRARQLYRGGMGDDGTEAGLIFEELVTHAIAAYLGTSHSVRFGLAGGSRGDELPAPLDEAVHELSRRMDEISPEVVSGSGDFRNDATSWKPFGDHLPGQMVMLCQATISEGDWIHKQPAERWSDGKGRLIQFVARPLSGVAFAETMSLTSTAALTGSDFRSVPFDRLRLLSLVGDGLPEELLGRMSEWVDGARERIPQ